MTVRRFRAACLALHVSLVAMAVFSCWPSLLGPDLTLRRIVWVLLLATAYTSMGTVYWTAFVTRPGDVEEGWWIA